jgi:hypothetical protein
VRNHDDDGALPLRDGPVISAPDRPGPGGAEQSRLQAGATCF